MRKKSEAIYTKWPKVGHLTLMANFWREKKLATKRTTPVSYSGPNSSKKDRNFLFFLESVSETKEYITC